MSSFRKASKFKSRLRAALDGPAGSGKTYSALRWAMWIAAQAGGRVAVISTEPGAAEKYIGENPDGIPFDFDVCELTDFAPTSFTDKILEAGRAGYVVIVIDSLSHAWQGALEIVDKVGKDAYFNKDGWRKITPMHNRLIDAMLRSPAHVIATMRTKTEYVIEQETRASGQIVNIPKKIGLKPIQREGMEYEFDLVCDVDLTHTMSVSKTRCSRVVDAVVVKPGPDFIAPVFQWLNEGIEAPAGTWTTDANQLNGSTELTQQAQQQAAAEAHEADRLRRIAAATGQQVTSATNGVGITPHSVVEQPPFDGGSVPGAASAATPAPAAAAVKVSVPQTPAIATTEQCIELAGLGEIIGRSIEEIAAMCVERYGVGPSQIPYAEMSNVLDAFRSAAAEVQQAAGNPTTAA